MTNEQKIVEEKVNSMEDNYKDLQALIECLNLDFDKFKEKKVKAAGQRVRNNLLNTKKLCDKIRKQILEQIRDIPVRHRTSDSEESPVEEKDEESPVEEKEEKEEKVEKEDKPKKKRTRKANIKKE